MPKRSPVTTSLIMQSARSADIGGFCDFRTGVPADTMGRSSTGHRLVATELAVKGSGVFRMVETGRGPLITNRLQIEPLRVDHAAGLFDSLSDPRVYEHIDGTPPAAAAELRERFARLLSGPPADRTGEQWLNCAVGLRVDGTLIGTLQASVCAGRAEVAYVFGPAYWGQGYAKEAMSALHEHLRQICGVREFWATTSPHNARSIRLLGRLGYAEACDSWPELAS